MSADKLILFVKAPRPGLVKTRLAQTVGADAACAAYRELMHAVVKNLATLPKAELCFAPADAAAEIQPWLRPGWISRAQSDGDLGRRLETAFATAFAEGAERVVIIGSDCPEVTTGDIRAAWRELRSHDIVLGPATDGGYWLIGLRQARPELFAGIAWSSETVLAETLRRAKSAGLRSQLLRILADVDTAEDWAAYQRGRK